MPDGPLCTAGGPAHPLPPEASEKRSRGASAQVRGALKEGTKSPSLWRTQRTKTVSEPGPRTTREQPPFHSELDRPAGSSAAGHTDVPDSLLPAAQAALITQPLPTHPQTCRVFKFGVFQVTSNHTTAQKRMCAVRSHSCGYSRRVLVTVRDTGQGVLPGCRSCSLSRSKKVTSIGPPDGEGELTRSTQLLHGRVPTYLGVCPCRARQAEPESWVTLPNIIGGSDICLHGSRSKSGTMSPQVNSPVITPGHRAARTEPGSW